MLPADVRLHTQQKKPTPCKGVLSCSVEACPGQQGPPGAAALMLLCLLVPNHQQLLQDPHQLRLMQSQSHSLLASPYHGTVVLLLLLPLLLLRKFSINAFVRVNLHVPMYAKLSLCMSLCRVKTPVRVSVT